MPKYLCGCEDEIGPRQRGDFGASWPIGAFEENAKLEAARGLCTSCVDQILRSASIRFNHRQLGKGGATVWARSLRDALKHGDGHVAHMARLLIIASLARLVMDRYEPIAAGQPSTDYLSARDRSNARQRKIRARAKGRIADIEMELDTFVMENDPYDEGAAPLDDEAVDKAYTDNSWWDAHNDLLDICKKFKMRSRYDDPDWEPGWEWEALRDESVRLLA